MENIPSSLEERHLTWIDAVNTGDIDAYVDLLAENAVWIPPGSEPIAGKTAFREWLEPFFSRYTYKFDINEERFIVAGNYALERARFTSEMTPSAGGDSMTHSGTFTAIWHRGQDGAWHIERYIDDTNL